MSVYKVFSLEPTNVNTSSTTTFNAPGVYSPPYGKTDYLLQGQGEPGNPNIPGNYAGTNPPTGSNPAYNPPTPGNYAGTNPGSGGNYAGTNPPVPGNYAGINPSTPGNTNPTTPGNYAGTNPATPGNLLYTYWIAAGYESGYYFGTNYSCPTPFEGSGEYTSYTCYPVTNPSTPGNAIYNSPTPGNTNPVIPGNVYFNPAAPGSAYYNPYVDGNPYYNPDTPGNLYYNPPTTPGTDYYNPSTPGNPGATTNVLGVTLPGGAGGSSAPVVGYVPVSITYSNPGTPVPVPSGGYVKIQNT
jgi:hypothetical protein